MSKKAKIILGGNVEVTQGVDTATRMAIFLWGPSSAGKTTFAATAPGKKLWISLGDNEHLPVVHRKDVLVADVSGMGLNEFFNQCESDNPFGLDRVLQENTDIETVVFDSATALAFRGLQRAVEQKVGAGKGFVPTMLAPGQSAYGGRNALTVVSLTGLLRVTAKHSVHCIITGHESDPKMRQEGNSEVIDYIGVMLGGQIVSNVSWRLSEIWHMSNDDTKDRRRLMIRPSRLRRPVKTRMFNPKGPREFFLDYDKDKPDEAKGQMTIAKFYEQWLDNDKKTIPAPDNMKKAGGES